MIVLPIAEYTKIHANGMIAAGAISFKCRGSAFFRRAFVDFMKEPAYCLRRDFPEERRMNTRICEWAAALGWPDLEMGSVHVWRVALDVEPVVYARLQDVLSSDEQDRAARFRFDEPRREFVVTRGVLRTLLGRYLGVSAASVDFQQNAHKKPALAPIHGDSNVRFNVSHSHDWALLAFARGRDVGVDVEAVRPDVEHEKLAERFFTPSETEKLMALPVDMRLKAFFDCWTRKEAYMKARGAGLHLGLDQVEVAFAPGEPPAVLRIAEPGREAERWTLIDLTPGPGYSAALAVEGADHSVICWDWSLNLL
jgi:4'-phosphopantetheinyl transferase